MPTTLGDYMIGKTLGKGASCKVKLAKNVKGDRFAIKIIREEQHELLEIENSILTKLNHPNIINLIEVDSGMQHNKKANAARQVKYAVLELAGGGVLSELLSLGGRLEEKYARYVFK